MRLLSEGWDVPAARDVRDSQDMPSSILLVGSSGGHLAQLVALRPWWATRERTWVTFQTEDARSKLREENVVWAYHPTTRHIPNMLRNLRLAVTILRRTRPDVVVSTGAGVAVPFFLIARLLGIPTVYLEVYDRLDSATLPGKLCRPLSTLFCVQWEEQRDLYKDAEVVGTLL